MNMRKITGDRTKSCRSLHLKKSLREKQGSCANTAIDHLEWKLEIEE